MTKYAIERTNGLISIMTLIDGELNDAIAKWQGLHPDEQIQSVHEVPEDQVPSDRTFREAWRRCEENGVRHCLPTARNILRDRLRARRAERFAETDLRLRDSLIHNRDASDVLGMVADLRDVTKHPAIDAAQSVEELKNVWPDVLEQAVPDLGEVRIAGDATYDTKALEEWGKSVTEKINQAATMRDLQEVLSKLDAKLESANDLSQRLERLEVVVPEIARAADFILKEARGPAELTQEELT